MNWPFENLLAGVVLGVVLITHLHLEYRFWVKKEVFLFAKYGGNDLKPEESARRAYLAKALWLNLLMVGWAGCNDFPAVLVTTFFLYSLVIVGFFRLNRYTGAQMLFAAVVFVAYWVRFFRQ